MILQENVKLIICVCRLVEWGSEKCHKYWPESDSRKERDFHLNTEGLVIVKASEKELCESLIERQFELLTPDGSR